MGNGANARNAQSKKSGMAEKAKGSAPLKAHNHCGWCCDDRINLLKNENEPIEERKREKGMTKILLAEDNKALNELMREYLCENGYDVVSCIDGAQAIEKLESGGFDMIISDVMMPNADGYDLAKKARLTDQNIPILFVTALEDKPSQQYSYKIGVDDYLVKPVDPEILVWKVGALLRRAKIEQSKELTVGNLRMNADEHTAYVDGEELQLTVREFDLLFKLLSYPKKAFSRSQLMDEFWDYDSSATSRTVDVYVAKLREKTADCDGFEIVTVHGLGYKAKLK